jgi:hypothetical protein
MKVERHERVQDAIKPVTYRKRKVCWQLKMKGGQVRTTLATIALPQLDELVSRGESLMKSSKYEDKSDLDDDVATEFNTSAMACIHRVAGANTQYAMQVVESFEQIPPHQTGMKVPYVLGALKALRHDVASGYLIGVQELIHADIFADFLEMAEYLLNEGYKDAAAVIIGGVLEEHMRKLCVKNGIPTESTDSKGTLKPKKVETMNSELAAATIYSKGDQKSITAWYDLRTNAAHGYYGKYTPEQVTLLLQSVRDFLTRYPA